jgi:hypothetical protein
MCPLGTWRKEEDILMLRTRAMGWARTVVIALTFGGGVRCAASECVFPHCQPCEVEVLGTSGPDTVGTVVGITSDGTVVAHVKDREGLRLKFLHP